MANIVIDNPITRKQESLTQPEFNSYMAQTNGAVLRWIVSSVLKHGDHDQSSHGAWATGQSIDGLQTQAKQFKTFEEFSNAISQQGLKPRMWHIAEDGFKLDPNRKPTNRLGGTSDEAGLFVGDPETWQDYAIDRKTVIEYDMTGLTWTKNPLSDTKADFFTDQSGNQGFFVRPQGFGKLKEIGRFSIEEAKSRATKQQNEMPKSKEEAKKIWEGLNKVLKHGEHDQISISDVANLKEIETGGTGGIEKTRVSQTARYVEHDRRADRQLRQRDLGEVSKRQPRYKVIYFDYGLKPVLKHDGHDDQSSHGNWATGRSEEDVKRISEFKDRGPTLDRLNDALDKSDGQIDRDKARMLIDNESYLNDEVEDRINNLIATIEEQNGEPMSEEERLANYDDYRNQVVEEYIDQEPDFLENFSQENNMGSLMDPEVTNELIESFQDVYSLEKTTEFKDGDRKGESVTLRSTVDEVTIEGNDIIVKSSIIDGEGNPVNSEDVVRVFSKDEESGTWSVEHKFLLLDKEYRGLGFGGQFLQQSEDYYVAKGLTHITLNAGLEDGARHWGNSGFDWNRDKLGDIVESLENAFEQQDFNIDGNYTKLMPVSQKMYAEDLAKGREILSRMKDSNGNIRDMKEDDFPTPKEFASLGAERPLIRENGKSTWAGKELLAGKYIPYMKILTAEGQNLLSGPIDMDGDGLVYDGTPREKPVSSVGKK